MLRSIFIIFISYWIAVPLSYQIRKVVRGDLVLQIARIIAVDVPFLIVYFIFDFPRVDNYNLSLGVIISLIFALCYILLDWKNISYANNIAVFPFLKKPKRYQLYSRFGEITIVPIIEELFFRGTIPINGDIVETLVIFIFSGLLFSFAHYIEESRELQTNLKLWVLSLFSFIIYFITKNIIFSIIFHVICNIPWFISNYRLYKYNIRRESLKYVRQK
ncbi:CPBP family intramembrane glutamic endopeptidase [Streptococcus pseudopneumoniae]|uniref:CPBP family intramembrane glutamic endopeptidase n=2 Tax=Streptococcus TaxID=1301 RepID=UPI0003D36AC2|nr:CPBP family intramembrane glutamic endopeptidase [Streptococcus pseudopneumoniae]ETE01497.1 CAAX amino terminal protease [Streptococcus pseudopneumoniae 5247]NIB75888.1 CPBP family intramembrane metalloprotease [Streptococcus pseudopneumoniae]